jgi:glucan-binding YG repeat protein
MDWRAPSRILAVTLSLSMALSPLSAIASPEATGEELLDEAALTQLADNETPEGITGDEDNTDTTDGTGITTDDPTIINDEGGTDVEPVVVDDTTDVVDTPTDGTATDGTTTDGTEIPPAGDVTTDDPTVTDETTENVPTDDPELQVSGDPEEDETPVDGWATTEIDGEQAKVYYKDGEIQKGIQTIDGKKYFLDETTGALHAKAGWVTDSAGNKYYTNKNGIIKTGWATVGGKRYYLDPKTGIAKTGEVFKVGKKLYLAGTNGAVITKKGWTQLGSDDYYVNTTTGELKTGWLQSGSKWYYLDPNEDGKLKTGTFTVNGKAYAANASGACIPNAWVTVDGNKYLTDSNCACRTGWVKSDGSWYYLKPSDGGKMAVGPFKDGGTPYVAQSNGVCPANKWVLVDGDWYLTNGSCACRTGWVSSGGKWYYLDPSTGKMATGWVTVNGKRYYMNGSGAMRTGWLNLDGTWYYLQSSGAAAKGWQKVGSQTYYFDKSTGAMAANCKKTIDGVTYEFLASGAVKSGWTKEGGNWYWYQANGKKATGWIKDGNNWYYLDPANDGVMVTGWKKINGKWNSFSKSSGAWYTDYALAVDGVKYANQYSSSTNWFILVDDAKTKVMVYHWEDGEWLPCKYFNCSVGGWETRTPKGLHSVVYKEYSFGDDHHTCYYATCFAWGDYLFHSVLYKPNSFNILDGTLNSHRSQGCIRLHIDAAKWIYNNVSMGSRVYIY